MATTPECEYIGGHRDGYDDTAHQTKADKPAKEHTTTKKESKDNG